MTLVINPGAIGRQMSFTVCHPTCYFKVGRRKKNIWTKLRAHFVRINRSGKWMDAAHSLRSLAASFNCNITNLAKLFLIHRNSQVSVSALPVSGLAGSGSLGYTPFYSYRWSFSKKGRGVNCCLLHECGSVPLQASEQRHEAYWRPRILSVRTVTLNWGLDRERRENLPVAELTAPVTVWPISVKGAVSANR